MSVSDMFWSYINAHGIKGINSIREVSQSLKSVNGTVTNVVTRLLINDEYFIDYIGGTFVGSYL